MLVPLPAYVKNSISNRIKSINNKPQALKTDKDVLSGFFLKKGVLCGLFVLLLKILNSILSLSLTLVFRNL